MLWSLLLLALGFQPPNTSRCGEPLDEQYCVRIVTTRVEPRGVYCCAMTARLLLVDRSNINRSWELAQFDSEREYRYQVERATTSAIVLSKRDPDNGSNGGMVKLFIDVRAKRLVKRTDYDAPCEVTFNSPQQSRQLLGVSPAGVRQLEREDILTCSRRLPEPPVPAPFAAYPMPQSTYAEFARQRPQRVMDGYGEADTGINEQVAAFQRVGDRLWFGRAFYDGESQSGVGAIGSVDVKGRYRFLRIPDLANWSVSALLVEPDTIWVGRVSNGEYGPWSGGLLAYDRKTARVTLYRIPEVVHRVLRVEGALFLGSTQGAYMLRGNVLTHIQMEPTLNGQLIPVTHVTHQE